MNKKQTVVGLLVLIAGFLLLLASFKIGNLDQVVSQWWPVVIIALGLLGFWNNSRHYTWPTILVTIGAILLLNNLELIEVNVGELILPLTLLIIGFNILLRALYKPDSIKTVNRLKDEIVTIMAGSETRNDSDDYQGGSVTAILGGADLDLSHAKIKNQAILQVTAVMGGVELKVAKDLVVKNRAQVIMGGFEDSQTPSATKSSPILYVDGTVVMGGIEIKRG